MFEIEDCTPRFFEPQDADNYILTVVSVSDKVAAGEGYQREWKFNVKNEELGIDETPWQKRFFASQVKDLMMCLGGTVEKSNPNKIKIDYATLPGKSVKCSISSATSKSKDGQKEFRNYKIYNVEEWIPF